MTHTYQTSVITSTRNNTVATYMVEVEDFNGDTHDFEVVARNFASASAKAASLCAEEFIDIYNMNIYKY